MSLITDAEKHAEAFPDDWTSHLVELAEHEDAELADLAARLHAKLKGMSGEKGAEVTAAEVLSE